MTSSAILGGLVGFLLGLVLCYWKQISAVYEKRDLITSGANLATSASDFWDQVRKV